MNDEQETRHNALTVTARRVAAKTALVNRGIALTKRIVREPLVEIVLPELSHLSFVGKEEITVFVGPAEAIDLSHAAAGGEWVLDWLKKEEDPVVAGEPLAELRFLSGEGTVAVRSPADGVLVEIRAKHGVVPFRSVVAVVDAGVRSGPEHAFAERAGDIEGLDTCDDALAGHGELAPTVKLVNVILMSAIEKGASDIHIEPTAKELFVRYRIDGVSYDIMQPPLKFRDAITSCVKQMSGLNPERIRQEGRIDVRYGDRGGRMTVIVSCAPTRFGEEIRMSLLPVAVRTFSGMNPPHERADWW